MFEFKIIFPILVIYIKLVHTSYTIAKSYKVFVKSTLKSSILIFYVSHSNYNKNFKYNNISQSNLISSIKQIYTRSISSTVLFLRTFPKMYDFQGKIDQK